MCGWLDVGPLYTYFLLHFDFREEGNTGFWFFCFLSNRKREPSYNENDCRYEIERIYGEENFFLPQTGFSFHYVPAMVSVTYRVTS